MNTEITQSLWEIIGKVEQWGIDKGITGPMGKATLLSQLEKTQEELTETRDAAIVMDFLWENLGQDEWTMKLFGKALTELMDGVGDVLVTLILACAIANQKYGVEITIEDCLNQAYDTIRNRNGKMIDGKFVKNNDE